MILILLIERTASRRSGYPRNHRTCNRFPQRLKTYKLESNLIRNICLIKIERRSQVCLILLQRLFRIFHAFSRKRSGYQRKAKIFFFRAPLTRRELCAIQVANVNTRSERRTIINREKMFPLKGRSELKRSPIQRR